MSDLSSNAARSFASSSITPAANQKLQNLSRGGVVRNGNAMVDAFAEVFATMAASSPAAAPPSAKPSAAESDFDTLRREPVDGQQQDESDDEVDSDTSLVDEASLLLDTAAESVVPVAVVDTANGNQPSDIAEDDSHDATPMETAVAAATGQSSADTNWHDPSTAATDQPSDRESGDGSASELTTNQTPIDDGNGSMLADQPDTDQSIAPTTSNDFAGTSGAESSAQDGQTLQNDGQQESGRDRRRGGDDVPNADSNQGVSNGLSATGGTRSESAPIALDSTSADVQPENAVPNAPESVKSTDHAHRAASTAVTAAAAQQNAASSSATRRSGGSDAIGAAARSESMSVPPPVGSRADAAANSKSAGDAKTNQADTLARIKLIQRVSKAFQHLGPEGGVVRLRLAPSEMGTVRVEMRIQQSKVEARVVADTEAASAALREHLPELRSRLESLGMKVESIEVETDTSAGQNDSSSSFRDQQAPWQRQPRQARQASAIEAPVSRPASPVVTTAGAGIRTGLMSGVDVRL